MFNLSEFAKSNSKPIFVYLADNQTALRFLQDVENQGFTFPDGTKPTEKQPNSFFAVHSDMSINYIGFIGRIAYQCKSGSIIRLDYAEKIAE
ncbi:MAG TPA: hypothetical protein GXZ23_05565 [Clostridiales bacterium]|nr:hypothetical protein [Clostridiales bacterium]